MAYTYESEIFGYVPPPACEPVAGKPWSCGGVNEVDRYDCIDGVITLTEKNSTACGYQEPGTETIEPPKQIPILLIMSVIGAGALAYVIFGRK